MPCYGNEAKPAMPAPVVILPTDRLNIGDVSSACNILFCQQVKCANLHQTDAIDFLHR